MKLGFETPTYPPFCTMSWNILFFRASLMQVDYNLGPCVHGGNVSCCLGICGDADYDHCQVS